MEPRADGLAGCVVGRGLRVGDQLLLARRCEGEVSPERVRTRWVEGPRQIHLTVRAIHAYGQSHQEWDAGMSALVDVEGDRSAVSHHNFIVTNEYALCAVIWTLASLHVEAPRRPLLASNNMPTSGTSVGPKKRG